MPIPANQSGAQPQRNSRAANMNPMGYKTPTAPAPIAPMQKNTPTQPLPGIGMSMQDLLAMFQQLMAQQQGQGDIGYSSPAPAPIAPMQNSPRPATPMLPTPPPYMDAAPPPPKVGGQSVPGMGRPQMGAITDMMKNTQGNLAPPTQPTANPMTPSPRNSSPNVASAFGPQKVRR